MIKQTIRDNVSLKDTLNIPDIAIDNSLTWINLKYNYIDYLEYNKVVQFNHKLLTFRGLKRSICNELFQRVKSMSKIYYNKQIIGCRNKFSNITNFKMMKHNEKGSIKDRIAIRRI